MRHLFGRLSSVIFVQCHSRTPLFHWRLSSRAFPLHLPPLAPQFPTNSTKAQANHANASLQGSCIRELFTLPGFEEDAAKKYSERKLLGYSPRQLYDVVADVDHYSEFVPWCQGSTVLSRPSSTRLEAELKVGFQMFVEKYISHVELQPYSMVRSRVTNSTLFSHLDSKWLFEKGPTEASVWLQFEIDFAFKNPLYRQVANLFFEEVAQRMIVAFERRCQRLYGPSSLTGVPTTK